MPAELDTTYAFTGQSLVAQQFNRLTVRAFAGAKIYYHPTRQRHISYHWLCDCVCGASIIVTTANLQSGHAQSCGCLQKESRIKHGYGGRKNRHSLYHVWDAMVQRCTNPNNKGYANYGGRGITVCSKWLRFEGFVDDMGHLWNPGLLIERVGNDGNYCKENCVFADRDTQNGNKRNTVHITINGVTRPFFVWGKEMGCNYSTARRRYKCGWPAERLFT
ncbi:MAG: hypothetical protein V4563_15770 [Pseudomonadota bacterium]